MLVFFIIFNKLWAPDNKQVEKNEIQIFFEQCLKQCEQQHRKLCLSRIAAYQICSSKCLKECRDSLEKSKNSSGKSTQ